MIQSSPSIIRDYTGIMVCALIVMASIGLGFVQVAIKVFFAVDVTFDPSWVANLSSMASMALGALIQQRVTQANSAAMQAAMQVGSAIAGTNTSGQNPSTTTHTSVFSDQTITPIPTEDHKKV